MHLCALPALALAMAVMGPAAAQMAALQRAVQAAEARSVRTGVAVCDVDGNVLYRHRAAENFTPASNMKLLTAAGLAHGLGADYTFRTAFRLERGELIVVASGDPNWIRDSEHDPAKVFGHVARELRERGVTEVRAVRLQPGTFLGPGRPATWPKNQLHAYYCAPTGPFVLQQGTFVMRIQRSTSRNALVSLVAPLAGYPVRGAIKMVGKKKGAVYGAIDKGHEISVRGKFYRKSPRVEIPTAMQDPQQWFHDALVQALRSGGVAVRSSAGAVSRGLVYEHQSGLEPALRRMLEDSSNFDAEQCLRVLGATTGNDGSLVGARDALQRALVDLVGEMPVGVVIADGSGLSKENQVTPGLLVVAMFRSLGAKHGAVLRAALPLAGKTGTLRSRFVGSNLIGRVRAKTGWIRGASALSGLLQMPDGSTRWFSILMNYDRSRNGLNKELKRLQENIVTAVAGLDAKR